MSKSDLLLEIVARLNNFVQCIRVHDRYCRSRKKNGESEPTKVKHAIKQLLVRNEGKAISPWFSHIRETIMGPEKFWSLTSVLFKNWRQLLSSPPEKSKLDPHPKPSDFNFGCHFQLGTEQLAPIFEKNRCQG